MLARFYWHLLASVGRSWLRGVLLDRNHHRL